MIYLKSKEEIALMRESGQKLAIILEEMSKMVVPGMGALEIDKFAESRCKELGCVPAFKGYHGFPSSVCISLNEECIHGIPRYDKYFRSFDIVGLDFGVIYNGWYADAARTVQCGLIESGPEKLLQVTEECLYLGITQCKVGNHLSDIGHVIQKHAEKSGFGVVRNYSGHGIGKALHEDPAVLNYGPKGQGIELEVGMVLAIEPMLTIGKPTTTTLNDGWTVVTRDCSLAAHFEHTVAITENGPQILTRL